MPVNELDFTSLRPEALQTALGERIKQASAIRWAWHPYKPISMMGPLGVNFTNSLTLSCPPTLILNRCMPYPLVNCEKEIPLHEAKRYDMQGQFMPEGDLPDTYQGAGRPGQAVPHVIEPIFAYSSARELFDSYHKERGLTILEPLTGVEDTDLIKQVFMVLQPETYLLKDLSYQLTTGAKERLAELGAVNGQEATLGRERLADVISDCQKLMQKGIGFALEKARQSHGDFSQDVQRAATGKKVSHNVANAHDEFVCEQLGVEVPRVVQTGTKNDRVEQLLTLMAQQQVGSKDELVNTLLEELRAEREERQRVSLELQQMLVVKRGGRPPLQEASV